MPGPESEVPEDVGTLRIAEGGPGADLSWECVEELLSGMLDELGELKRVLLIPPDHTRIHSGSGEITCLLWKQLQERGARRIVVLPALGTHVPMTGEQLQRMYPGIPPEAFVAHQWRTDVRALGEVPADFVGQVSQERVHYPITCEANRLLLDEEWDRIISIGQAVPHEVVGIANHSKNIFVGTGGRDTINKTHFLGAVCNMEHIMGRIESPVRQVLDYMSREFATGLPLTYVLTVREGRGTGEGMTTRGLFCGEGRISFTRGARLSQQVNIRLLDQPIRRAVVWLDPHEFHSTWLGNKAIYRLRMAMADDGELIVLAPGVDRFGEDREIDALIRKHGYRTTKEVLAAVGKDPALGTNLAAAAHLIHGSSEGRFRIVYATGKLSREEVESVGYGWMNPEKAMNSYSPARLSDGANENPDVFFVRNPALGLWALRENFGNAATS